ncbi:hypothetical protein MRX96_023849 [Rhipicephalus microplus]
MITATLCHMLLPLVQTVCSVAPREHAPSFYNYQNRMPRGTYGACTIVLPLPKSDCCFACLGFAGGTHIDILLVDAPAIMGFRIERHTVKFANYKGAATITTALWARWLSHRVF